MSPLNVKRELKKFPLKTISSAFFRQVHLTNPSQFLQFLLSQALLTNASKEVSTSIIIVYEIEMKVNIKTLNRTNNLPIFSYHHLG